MSRDVEVPEGLSWGYKLVGTDLCTDDHRGGRFRYRPGEWHRPDPVDGQAPTLGDACPAFPGDGLCVAKTLPAAQSGGAVLGSCVGLLVGYRPEDVLGQGGGGKVRVARLWVAPEPFDPLAAYVGPGANLVRANLGRANLDGANLGRANLDGANLVRANLGGANLGGAYLGGANLGGAYLGGAYLGGANLVGANLVGANLGRAYLGRAYLDGANLGGAYLGDWERDPVTGYARRKGGV